MDYPGNNLFQFATKELSQDAMICWLINNFNYPEQDKELYQLSIKLVRSLLGGKAPDKIESVRILQQYNSIDVLLIVNQRIAVIVEDKVWSSEHGDQIKKYRESVERELANPNSRKALLGVDVEQSETAIVKTRKGSMFLCVIMMRGPKRMTSTQTGKSKSINIFAIR